MGVNSFIWKRDKIAILKSRCSEINNFHLTVLIGPGEHAEFEQKNSNLYNLVIELF